MFSSQNHFEFVIAHVQLRVTHILHQNEGKIFSKCILVMELHAKTNYIKSFLMIKTHAVAFYYILNLARANTALK